MSEGETVKCECGETLPLRRRWIPFGDGSNGSWEQIVDPTVWLAHLLEKHSK